MTDTIDTVKVKGRKRATLALLLSLGTLGASVYIYYQSLKVHAHTFYQLQSLDSATLDNAEHVQQMAATLNKQINILNGKIEAISSNKLSANNYQINTLVSLANQNLVAYHDVNSAIKLLNYALDVTQASNEAIYTELKVALTTDIDRLKQLPVLDRVVIATKLNNIILSADQLELIITDKPAANTDKAENISNPKWKVFLSNIRDKISGLVQVSSANKNDALNLLPQNTVIIHQNVKLDILNARMALLQNDEANWQYSLNAAKQSLSSYFINSANMKNTLNEIEQLRQLNISYSDVDIEKTLKALNKLNNLSANDVH
jgi:uroporphyrin-III C-methyltransferase